MQSGDNRDMVETLEFNATQVASEMQKEVEVVEIEDTQIPESSLAEIRRSLEQEFSAFGVAEGLGVEIVLYD